MERIAKLPIKETAFPPLPAGSDNWEDRDYKAPLGGDAVQNYTQRYTYDAVGNILELRHLAGVGSYTRSYGYGTSDNRLVTSQVGNSPDGHIKVYSQIGIRMEDYINALNSIP